MNTPGKIALIFIFLGAIASGTPAQSIFGGGKVPKDLVIELSLGGTIQFSTHYSYKITARGKVFYEVWQSGLPVAKSFDYTLFDIKTGKKIVQGKPAKPELKDKLSKKQIKQILLEFEKSGFFAMDERYEGDKTLKEITCINHAEAKGISVSANGKTKKVWFFLGCSYGEKSPLKDFLGLYDKISEILKGVKKVKLDKTESV